MQKTYINYFKNIGYNDFQTYQDRSLEESLKWFVSSIKKYPTRLEYIFTLEINENGEGRIFKHELPKKPVKSYINFFKAETPEHLWATDSFKTLQEAKRDSENRFFKKGVFSFTKCFDETGKEYPIEKEE